MKAILLFLLIISSLPEVHAQQKIPVSHDREYFLNRSRNKKIPGYVLLASGIGLTVSGIAASSSGGGIMDMSDLGPPLVLGGFALTAGGVALLRSAKKDMIRAAEVSAGRVGVPHMGGFGKGSICMQPAIILRVKFR